eukprot:GFYU01006119.1.p1 GENE.GFYU01006119.1~~GFYU01006119.1.p1  ORF type:complete len:178 (-),score=6.88 GFYU01006119.1:84-617(-)
MPVKQASRRQCDHRRTSMKSSESPSTRSSSSRNSQTIPLSGPNSAFLRWPHTQRSPDDGHPSDPMDTVEDSTAEYLSRDRGMAPGAILDEHSDVQSVASSRELDRNGEAINEDVELFRDSADRSEPARNVLPPKGPSTSGTGETLVHQALSRLRGQRLNSEQNVLMWMADLEEETET